MTVSETWPVEGQDPLLGDVLSDLDFALPLPENGQYQEGTTEGTAALQHLLPDFDFWPFTAGTGQEVNGDSFLPQPVPLHPALPQQSTTPESTPTPSQASLSSQDADSECGFSDSSAPFEIHRSKNIFVELPKSTLVHPRSEYDGFVPPLPPSKERHAVTSLMEAVEAEGNVVKEDFIEFELDSFCFYIYSAHYPSEMRPLQHLTTRIAHGRFFFDGVLSFGNVRHYVQQVEVSELPIGNYGVSNPTVGSQIWVRSRLNSAKEVYYRLKTAAIEYAGYYTPFLWVADFAKHVVDYSAAMTEQRRQVSIDSFREDFIQWLLKFHSQSPEFQSWMRKHPSRDYRTSVMANIDFIWKEMNGVLGKETALSLQLFRETMHFNLYPKDKAPPLPMVVQRSEKDSEQEQKEAPTVVTPYIQECFGHMVIGKMLRTIGGTKGQPPKVSTALKGAREMEHSPALPTKIPSSKRSHRSQPCFLPLQVVDQVKAGDTISTPRDGDSTDTKWRSIASKGAAEDHRWFALVQKVHTARDGSKSFDVSWFYRPADTPCCMMKYPWPNELFLSDHCTCEEGSHARVKEHEVLAVHDIDWFGSPDGKGEFFVRQIYMIQGRRWITLQQSHITCSHGPQRIQYRAGDTVLAALSPSAKFSEPFEVIKVFKQGEFTFVRLRRLLRRKQVDPRADAAPNELVYTEQLVVAKLDKIIGKCLVRFFKSGELIPSPYNRMGTGNLFYITHRLDETQDGSRCVAFDEGDFPTSLRQGFDLTRQTFRKLRGMDLFCGSGNFGRGLEEGGAVSMLWANDIWDRAIHSYMANSPDPKATRPFLGSVDDLLHLALKGKYSANVPRPGEVEFISAGSPCPGFSLLTQDKTKLNQIKNQSLVASFAAFVDFYRPKYGILENVTSIVQARHTRSEDVLSQLFCAIVGMGYQAQLILGDAWSHGAPQCRNRVFLYFAAPGLQLPDPPLPSHSHYDAAPRRGLGELCNGEPFVQRSFQPTPFSYVSAAQGTADLPRIGDGKAEPSVAFPDHRVCGGITELIRHQIAAIPTHPYGMKFATAWREGSGKSVMTPAERELFPKEGFRVSKISQGWRRVRPHSVFATVTTRSQPTDARAATGLHWYDDRPLTVHEIRRAQGFLDEEVLLGTLADQWKLVGNSVARQMALALGLKLREAWAASVRAEGGRGESVGAGIGSSVVGSVGREKTGTPSVGEMVSRVKGVSVGREERERSSTATPASDGGSMRKRVLSQTVAAEMDAETEKELPPAKTRRLSSGRSASVSPALKLLDGNGGSESGSGYASDASSGWEPEVPVRTGPTVVRLLLLDEMGWDGLGPADDLD